MPNTQKATIHGVSISQIQLQGKYYTPVDARVKIAEQADPALIRREGAGYNVLSVQFVQLGDKWAYHCMVEYPAGSGIVTPGSDFIDMKDPSGVAKAETSAIGRALGLHGIAIEESIASAEEMSRVEELAPTQRPANEVRSQQPAQAQATITEMASHVITKPQQLDLIRKMTNAGYKSVTDKEMYLAETLGRPIDFTVLGRGQADITIAELQQVLAGLEQGAHA